MALVEFVPWHRFVAVFLVEPVKITEMQHIFLFLEFISNVQYLRKITSKVPPTAFVTYCTWNSIFVIRVISPILSRKFHHIVVRQTISCLSSDELPHIQLICRVFTTDFEIFISRRLLHIVKTFQNYRQLVGTSTRCLVHFFQTQPMFAPQIAEPISVRGPRSVEIQTAVEATMNHDPAVFAINVERITVRYFQPICSVAYIWAFRFYNDRWNRMWIAVKVTLKMSTWELCKIWALSDLKWGGPKWTQVARVRKSGSGRVSDPIVGILSKFVY